MTKKAEMDKLRDAAGLKGIDLSTGGGAADRAESELDSRQRDLLAAKEDFDARRVLLHASPKSLGR